MPFVAEAGFVIRYLFAWLAAPLALISLYPLVRRAVLIENGWRLEAALVGFGFSAGGVSLAMLYLGLLPGAWVVPWIVLPVPFAFGAWSAARLLRGRQVNAARLRAALWQQLEHNRPLTWFGLAILGSLIVILINSAFYPFYRDDTLARYGVIAEQIFAAQRIPSTLYGYPLSMMLLYVFTFLASGDINSHVAGAISAAFAVAYVGAAFALGRRMFTRRVGWVAALLTATTPLFVDWATSGYVDVANGFYHTLAALFMFEWLQNGRWRDALLTGLLTGLATWTKQSGLQFLPPLAIIVLWRFVSLSTTERRGRFKLSKLPWPVLGAGLAILGSTLLIVAPWMLRNYVLGGFEAVAPVPAALVYTQTPRGWRQLVPFLFRLGEWGWPLTLTGLAGFVYAAIVLVLGGRWTRGLLAPLSGSRRRILLLLIFIAPYHLVWWWWLSFEARYLLTILPLYAILAAVFVDRLLAAFPGLARIPWWGVAALSTTILFSGVFGRLGAVYHTLRAPLETDAEKYRRFGSQAFLAAEWIRAHTDPQTDRITMMDGNIAYFLYDYDYVVQYPQNLESVADFDYLIVAPWADDVYAGLGVADNELQGNLADAALFREVYRTGDPGQIIYQLLIEP